MNKNCQNCKKDFTIDSEDFNFYEKIKVPSPTFCPECRFARRLCWRNDRSFYKRKCDMCKKDVISVHDIGVSFPVFCPNCWYSDKWDGGEYARDYDFSKPFFEQWKDLFYSIPHYSLRQVGNCINSEYANFIEDVKNIYLSYSTIFGSEDVFYSNNVDYSKNIIDSLNVSYSELVYENIGCNKNYNCQYSYWSSNCIDCNFVLDCINCQNCFSCVNLRNKNYCIKNIQYSREEYFEKIKEFNMGSYKFIQNAFNDFFDFSLKYPRKYSRMINCVNSTGDELRDCKNSLFSFNSYDSENIKFVYRSIASKDSMDISYIGVTELAYECGFGGAKNSQKIKFIIEGRPALDNVEYSDSCGSSSNLFGCVGLKNKQNCILNKQYTKEEYEELIPKIKKHMMDMPYLDKKGRIYMYGEFFPFEFSPFGYNETVINEFYPLEKEQALQKGYGWKEKIENEYIATKKAEDLPDDIKDVTDSILNEVIECSITKKAFKITPFELQFYRRMNIPIPRIHHDERYKKRIALRNPLKLWHRKCMKKGCQNVFETSYSQDRPEIVYCEKCYQQEVY